MASHQHCRTLSHPKKSLPANARPTRPALINRRSNGASTPKAKNRGAQKKGEEEEDNEVMAASFLQYCATCEKQIIVPNNSVLYCSESCRRKDSNKILESPPSTPFPSTFDIDEDPSIPDIVPRRSPRAPNFHRLSSAFSEVSDEDNGPSDPESQLSKNSEAARYLRQFQSNVLLQDSSLRPPPRTSRSTTAIVATSTAPSLSHTPTSTASLSLPYTPLTRPLPPRGHHSFGWSSYGSKSVDLVLPFASVETPTASASLTNSFKTPAGAHTFTDNVEAEMRYEKRRSMPLATPVTQGSLKMLLDDDSPHRTPSSSRLCLADEE